ncbi:YceI family protein [Mycobacterium sp.]|uniref:YceI family protein n=1 Tax=Mycobacterium sp. TaxID=1785 RepID=UPI00126ACC23|nr:YceI family protein [Mycobacterium sp.]KAA8962864.1 MAG: YceI family protein [Mycobacterium sp.]
MTTAESLLRDPNSAGVWNLVPDRSTFGFTIRNLWGLMAVRGDFTEASGDGQVTAKGAVFGRLDIRAASVRTGIRRRDEHLRSADFFDVERFPDISVVVTAVEPTTGNAADLRATFSIKGVDAPLPLPATITRLGDGSVRVSATTQVERARFHLDWNRLAMIAPTATASAEAVFVRAR